jgi:cholesterol oxidase
MPATPPRLGVKFTETMHGYVSDEITTDFASAAEAGKHDGTKLDFLLTVASDDLDRLLGSEAHPAAITGIVNASILSEMPLTVEHGEFHLFVDDRAEVGEKLMKYEMRLRDAQNKPYFFEGTKTVRSGSILHLWPETTTLYITVYEGADALGKVALRGILTMNPADFAKQLTTVAVTGAKTTAQELEGIARFGKFFGGVLFETYGGVFAGPTPLAPDAPPRKKRPLRAGAPEVHPFKTSDGLELRLTRYRGGDKGPLMMVHGLGVSSLIFAIDTIETNLVEFFVAHGYDLWLLDYRSSIDLPYADGPYTGDDVATKDYPGAVAEVRRLTGAETVQCLVHCFGATTFFMAMLAGLKGVRSAAVSQIATHSVVPTMTHIMSGAHVPQILDKLLHVRTMSARTGTDFLDEFEDVLLRAYPVNAGPGDTNPVSRRISFLYGQLYELAQLNEDTYKYGLGEMFGMASIKTLEQLATCVNHGHVVSAGGLDVYLPHLERLQIPLGIVHGELNRCWLPESTRITYDTLRQRFDPALYARHLVPGYGHIDCIFGKDAARDVYPLFLDHLEKTAIV